MDRWKDGYMNLIGGLLTRNLPKKHVKIYYYFKKFRWGLL